MIWLLFGALTILALSGDSKKTEYDKQKLQKEVEEKKEIINKRVELSAKGIPSCPHCASTYITTLGKNRNSISGRYEYTDITSVCQFCGHQFHPKEGRIDYISEMNNLDKLYKKLDKLTSN